MTLFLVLWRALFAQFFTSETTTSDDQLRRTIVWVLAFLLMPGGLLIIELFFDYQGIVLRAIRYQQFDRLDDALEWIAFLFVTYSMVTVGFIAVCEWDALAFDRRDAMILGPLPLRAATIVTAKVAALGAFLLAASTTVNLTNAAVFAVATADRLGGVMLLRHFAALFIATAAGAAFVFAALVVTREAIGLVAGPRVAAAAGSLLQFAFALALLGIVILCPAVWRVPHRELVNPQVTGWLPTSWFLGLFEGLRGSRRAYFQPLATRAVMATAGVTASAVLMSIAGFHHQMQYALATAAPTGPGGRAARLAQVLARTMARPNRLAGATTDFILLTLIRNRAQQMPVAMNAAVGVAIICGGLTQVRNFASLADAGTTLLSGPLLLAYWLAIGLRAAFFVPSELPASWTFHANASDLATGYWSAVRASMLTVVLPPTVVVAAGVTVPWLGWRVAAWHVLIAGGAAILTVGAIAQTIDFVPFTRAYTPGHARLRTRWPLYVIGMYFFAFWPARLELMLLSQPAGRLVMLAALCLAIVIVEAVGRSRAVRWSLRPPEGLEDEMSTFTVLDIGVAVQGASRT